MIMKKFLAIVLAVTCCLGLIACGGEEENKLYFYAPDGAPALAIAKFIDDGEDFDIGTEISYNVVSASDIGTVMAQAKGDFIVMPVNAASKLYKAKKDSPYIMVAVITHGNLYLMSSENINTLNDLKGKVVGVIGQGLVPDLTLRAILSDKRLIDCVVVGDTATGDKITFRYFETAQDMIPMLRHGDLAVGLLPEPAATNLTAVANDKMWKRIDIQKLYDAEKQAYPQAVLMVKKSVYESNAAKLANLETMFNENVLWIKSNTAAAVQAVNSHLKEGVTPSLDADKITPSVIDNCKIYFESAASAKQSVKDYIDKIIAVNASSATPPAIKITEDFFA